MSIHQSTGVNKRKLLARTTKKNIKEAALKLFEQYGFDIVTIEDIAKEAGVSKGSFYVYYSSKDEILVKEYKKIDNYYEDVIKIIPVGTPVLDQIRILSAAVFDSCAKMGLHIIRVMYINQISQKVSGGEDPEGKFLNDQSRLLFRKLNEICEQGIKTGVIKPGITAEAVVAALTRVYHGTLYDWCLHDGDFDLEKDGARNIEILLCGLTKKE
jgi:AcrR family transcriptional regulator